MTGNILLYLRHFLKVEQLLFILHNWKLSLLRYFERVRKSGKNIIEHIYPLLLMFQSLLILTTGIEYNSIPTSPITCLLNDKFYVCNLNLMVMHWTLDVRLVPPFSNTLTPSEYAYFFNFKFDTFLKSITNKEKANLCFHHSLVDKSE